MALARHGTGRTADLRAAASQVHPVFMLPALAASAFGAVLADRVVPSLFALHLLATFAALYTAHVKDGYVDFHGRGEDDDHPVTAAGCRRLLVASSALFFVCLVALVALVDVRAGLLTLPGWLIGYFHAPQLDVHPLGASAGYPAGIGFTLLGGHYVQAGTLSSVVISFAAVFVVVLVGIKVIDDTKDYAYDRSIDKRTVAVLVGPDRAVDLAYGAMAIGLLAVIALAARSVFPPSSIASVAAFSLVAVVARRAEPEVATMLLVRGSYVFLALLLAAVWFHPLS